MFDRVSELIDEAPGNGRRVSCLRNYVKERGGEYFLTTSLDVVTPDEMCEALTDAVMAGPATIVRLTSQGRENIYSFMSWKKGTRRLVAQRLPDDRFEEDPYQDDKAIDTLISTPRARIGPSYTVECGGCGRVVSVRGVKRRVYAERVLRDHGWSNTSARGWVCPRHAYTPRRSFKKKARAIPSTEVDLT